MKGIEANVWSFRGGDYDNSSESRVPNVQLTGAPVSTPEWADPTHNKNGCGFVAWISRGVYVFFMLVF